MNEKTTHIIKDIASCTGGGERTKLYVIASIATGETEVVLEKTIIKRMPIQEYEEAEKLYEKLNDGGGRYIVSIEDIIKLSRTRH